ncbi:MAG: hypothetical protein AzoDbin1_04238 [Azoarcus sp.]|nr:hypothetical protein [Azoarcus sp.]
MGELKYIPVAEYTIGCCHYGKQEPYKTVDVKADSLAVAMAEGRKLLKPSTAEHLCHVETRPNPEHVASLEATGLLPKASRVHP